MFGLAAMSRIKNIFTTPALYGATSSSCLGGPLFAPSPNAGISCTAGSLLPVTPPSPLQASPYHRDDDPDNATSGAGTRHPQIPDSAVSAHHLGAAAVVAGARDVWRSPEGHYSLEERSPPLRDAHSLTSVPALGTAASPCRDLPPPVAAIASADVANFGARLRLSGVPGDHFPTSAFAHLHHHHHPSHHLTPPLTPDQRLHDHLEDPHNPHYHPLHPARLAPSSTAAPAVASRPDMMDTGCAVAGASLPPLGPGPPGTAHGMPPTGLPGHPGGMQYKEEPVFGPGGGGNGGGPPSGPGLGPPEAVFNGNVSGGGAQKEICAGCQRPIEDRFLLKVMDNSWHEHCLQCSYCAEPLTHSCYVKDRKLLCKVDYDKYYGTKCSGCLHAIPPNEFVMRAVNKVYHVGCFLCGLCGQQLQKGDQYVLKDDQLYCRLDFEKEYAALMQMSPAKADWCTPFSPKRSDGTSWSIAADDDSSVDENEGLENNKGPKRPRTILTTSQRRKFKASFEVNPKPCRKVREALASETGLSVRVVQVWFQNQRAKVKKLARRQTTDTSENGNNRKNNNNNNNTTKSANKRPKKDDDEGEDSSSQTDNNITGNLYTPQPLTDNMYDSQIMSEGGMDGIDDVIMPHQGAPGTGTGNQSSLINPIDKLYSMQNSFFNE